MDISSVEKTLRGHYDRRIDFATMAAGARAIRLAACPLRCSCAFHRMNLMEEQIKSRDLTA
jgi:hypothetical protein